ncbi:MAG: hypothetical protein U9N54_01360 [candidate division Zixibacteria bacterium]|nr:hypothetical protein [candidate division Zixibacteria bacterium]
MSKTLKLGLLGHQIGYSKSGDIFNAIFEMLSIDGEFISIDVSHEKIDEGLQKCLDLKLNGFSVTIPHKQNVIPFLNQIENDAMQLGAVNSIKIENNKLSGFNTDIYGFCESLKEYSSILKGKKVLIIGAGGSARAIIYALKNNFGIKDFVILGRDKQKLDLFLENLKPITGGANLSSIMFDSELPISPIDYDFAVNCSPLGGFNYPDELIFNNNISPENLLLYYDLNYNDNNSVIKKMQSINIPCIDGKQMLVAQALKSLYLWTGLTVSENELYQKVFGS